MTGWHMLQLTQQSYTTNTLANKPSSRWEPAQFTIHCSHSTANERRDAAAMCALSLHAAAMWAVSLPYAQFTSASGLQTSWTCAAVSIVPKTVCCCLHAGALQCHQLHAGNCTQVAPDHSRCRIQQLAAGVLGPCNRSAGQHSAAASCIRCPDHGCVSRPSAAGNPQCTNRRPRQSECTAGGGHSANFDNRHIVLENRANAQEAWYEAAHMGCLRDSCNRSLQAACP